MLIVLKELLYLRRNSIIFLVALSILRYISQLKESFAGSCRFSIAEFDIPLNFIF